jgi:hypothetical protein
MTHAWLFPVPRAARCCWLKAGKLVTTKIAAALHCQAVERGAVPAAVIWHHKHEHRCMNCIQQESRLRLFSAAK